MSIFKKNNEFFKELFNNLNSDLRSLILVPDINGKF